LSEISGGAGTRASAEETAQDPFERAMAFKGSILKAVCLPHLEQGRGIISLTDIPPSERGPRLDVT